MKKGDVLKLLERHKMLTFALEREITQAKAARELRLSLPHTKKLIKRLKETGGSYEALLYRRNHPAPNRLPEDIRGKVVALKRENRGRSNPLIADLIFDEVGVRVHPNTVRNILLERGEAPLLSTLPLPLLREGGQGDRLINDLQKVIVKGINEKVKI